MRNRLGGRGALLVGLVVIALLAPAASNADGPSGSPRSHDFSDVSALSPFHDAISWMATEQFVLGYPEGTYRPELVLSRQHIAQILWRMSGSPSTTTPEPFIDVDSSSPFYDAIRWGYATETFQGTTDNRFQPHAAITRQALGAMLHRLSGITKTYGDRTFTDVPANHVFNPAIAWWVNSGQAKGYTDGSFRPTNAVTRQTAAQFLSLFHEMMGGAWPYFDHGSHAAHCHDPITPAQQQAADDLLADVLVEVADRWPTKVDALAAGYQVVAPAFAGEGEHLLHPEYTKDGIQLDPTKPESLVLDTSNQNVAAAMFVRESVGEHGPQIGGCLTLWHAHDNLCYDAPFLDGGMVIMIAGLLGPGCPAGSMVRITPGMLHVWVDGRPDPFEGIET